MDLGRVLRLRNSVISERIRNMLKAETVLKARTQSSLSEGNDPSEFSSEVRCKIKHTVTITNKENVDTGRVSTEKRQLSSHY